MLILLFLVVSFFVKGMGFSERKKEIQKRADLARKEREKELLMNLAKRKGYHAYVYFFLSMITILGIALAPIL